MMIPDSKYRLQQTIADLSTLVEDCREEPGLNPALLSEANEIITAFQG